MATIALQPVFTRASKEEYEGYNQFMLLTSPDNIVNYGKGGNLEKLAYAAENAYSAVCKGNPFTQAGSVPNAAMTGMQWELNCISDIKRRLAQAIEYKHAYYERTVIGTITRLILKCLGLWNEGNTAAIIKAEKFLIRYDSRMPLLQMKHGYYAPCLFFPLVSAAWVRANLDMINFFNYNPQRAISVVHNFRYDALDPLNPQVIIRS